MGLRTKLRACAAKNLGVHPQKGPCLVPAALHWNFSFPIQNQGWVLLMGGFQVTCLYSTCKGSWRGEFPAFSASTLGLVGSVLYGGWNSPAQEDAGWPREFKCPSHTGAVKKGPGPGGALPLHQRLAHWVRMCWPFARLWEGCPSSAALMLYQCARPLMQTEPLGRGSVMHCTPCSAVCSAGAGFTGS